jgi:hypothetical protein
MLGASQYQFIADNPATRCRAVRVCAPRARTRTPVWDQPRRRGGPACKEAADLVRSAAVVGGEVCTPATASIPLVAENRSYWPENHDNRVAGPAAALRAAAVAVGHRESATDGKVDPAQLGGGPIDACRRTRAAPGPPAGVRCLAWDHELGD